MKSYGLNISIVFLGSGPVAAASLDFLIKNFTIEAVITKAKAPHHHHDAPVEELAKKNNLKILFANNTLELDQLIESTKFVSKIGMIIDFGVIVSKKTIEHFEMGIINSHFSLLPQWRGADPITFSILSGQLKTGVSLMVVNEGLDTGQLIAIEEISIDPTDNQNTLTKKLVEKSNSMLLEFIPEYLYGEAKPFDQENTDQATYSKKLSKQDGLIDSKKTAIALEREIRAYLGWPGSRILFKNISLKIKKAHVDDHPITELDIICSDKKYLVIDELVAPSGKSMSAKSFLNGYFN